MDLDESTRDDPVDIYAEGCLIRQLPERPLVATCLRCKAITSASFLPANGPVGMIANDLRMWSNMMRDACTGCHFSTPCSESKHPNHPGLLSL